MLKASWAYSLKRDELVACLGEFHLDATGSVDELRRRWAKFIGAEHSEDEIKRLMDIQTKHESTATSPAPGLTVPAEHIKWRSPVKEERTSENKNMGAIPKTTTETRIDIIERVRRWGVRYDGKHDPLEFIERVEELSQMYCVPLDQLPPIMPEFLCNRALVWFRNNYKEWKKWDEFKLDFSEFFLPPRYHEKLEDEIQKCTQRPNENFKDFLLKLQNLMRHSKLSESQKLERIFRNCHPDYQWYIRRKDFSSLSELTTLAEDLESIKTSSQRNSVNHDPLGQHQPRCQSCGATGHRSNRCTNHIRNPENHFGGRQN